MASLDSSGVPRVMAVGGDASNGQRIAGSKAKTVQAAADELMVAKTKLHTNMKIICAEIDSMYKISSEFSKDTRRLERGVDSLPVLEDWITDKVSAIEQLKAQIVFLHKVMDEG